MFSYTLALIFYCFNGTTLCVAVAIHICFSTYVSIYFSPNFYCFIGTTPCVAVAIYIYFSTYVFIYLIFYCFIGTTSCVAVAIYICFSTYVSIYFSPNFLLFHCYYLMCCSSYLYMFHYMCFHILQPRFPNVGPSCFFCM